MLDAYRDILRLPGAALFCGAGFLARFSMSMEGISWILAVRAAYGSYALAGAVGAAQVIAYAVFAPVLSRWVDRYGQAPVMAPSIGVAGASLLGSVAVIAAHAPAWMLFALSALGGAASGPIGALVRARWSRVVRTPAQLRTAFALESVLDEAVYVLGPMLAAALCTTVHPVAGLAACCAFVVGGGALLLAQRSTEPPASAPARGEARRSAMADPVMGVLAATYVAAGVLFGANDLAVVAFTVEHGAASLSGVMLAVFSLGSLTGGLVYGGRHWRAPLWKLFALGVGALGLGVTTFVLARTLPVLALVMFVTGLSIAPTMTNVNTIVQRIQPPHRLTEGLTWMTTAISAGASAGSWLGGVAVDRGGAHAGFGLVVAAAWATVAIMLAGLRTLRARVRGHTPAV